MCKTLRLVRIFLLISVIQRVLHFFSAKLFYKSNKKLFSCVYIAWYKHERGWENSWQLCKPLTSSRVCITVPNSPNPSRVYIRLYKHRKHFLLLWLWGKYRVRKLCILKVLESPCLNFKIKIALKVLENCSRGWKVLEFQCLLYPTQQTQRNLQDEIAHVVQELKKDLDSRLFFALNGVLDQWEMSLKVLEKSLNFLFKKRSMWTLKIVNLQIRFFTC